MKKLYFMTGSQDLYGEETLARVAEDGKAVAAYLDDKLNGVVRVEHLAVGMDSDGIYDSLLKAGADRDCVGVIVWMHTFSPQRCGYAGSKRSPSPCSTFTRSTTNACLTRTSTWIS